MERYRWRLAFLLGLCVFFALVLKVLPLPYTLAILRPELLCLFVIYWVINQPHQFGVFFAWSLGLLQDAVELNVWGAHALALTVVAYICLLSWQRIRSYSIWQQAMWVFVLLGTHQVIVSWVQGMAGYHIPTHLILLPTLTGALLWPLCCWLLRRMQQRLHILSAH